MTETVSQSVYRLSRNTLGVILDWREILSLNWNMWNTLQLSARLFLYLKKRIFIYTKWIFTYLISQGIRVLFHRLEIFTEYFRIVEKYSRRNSGSSENILELFFGQREMFSEYFSIIEKSYRNDSRSSWNTIRAFLDRR